VEVAFSSRVTRPEDKIRQLSPMAASANKIRSPKVIHSKPMLTGAMIEQAFQSTAFKSVSEGGVSQLETPRVFKWHVGERSRHARLRGATWSIFTQALEGLNSF